MPTCGEIIDEIREYFLVFYNQYLNQLKIKFNKLNFIELNDILFVTFDTLI